MDFDKMHAKCFAALPRIAKGTVAPKLMTRAERHMAECGECREELARLRAGGKRKPREPKAAPAALADASPDAVAGPEDVPPSPAAPVAVPEEASSDSVALAAVPEETPSSPAAPVDAPKEAASRSWWVPVLVSVLVLETALLGWVLFESSQPTSTLVRCLAGKF